MALKVSPPKRVAFFLISLSVMSFGFWSCRVATETEPVRLESLTVGVSCSAPMRYRVTNLKVGDVSVLHLFNIGPREKPVWWTGGYFREDEIRLVITSGEQLQELKQILIAHPDPHPRLEVILEADQFPVWSRLPGLNSENLYRRSIFIPIKLEVPTCENITHLIYEKIISRAIKEKNEDSTGKKMEGETEKYLDVNEVFRLLRDDHEIETYIASMDSVTNNPCAKTIQLLKSLKEEKASGFDSGKYLLRQDLQRRLDLIIEGMKVDPGWSKSELSLKVTGFTDMIDVRKPEDKELRLDRTGISADIWNKVNKPLEVYYSGCIDNKLDGNGPVYFSSITSEGEPRDEHRIVNIVNNCELGAVRAYVTMVYLASKLGRISPDDSYATGGVYSGSDIKNKKADDPDRRRIHVEITIKAARADK